MSVGGGLLVCPCMHMLKALRPWVALCCFTVLFLKEQIKPSF